MTGKAKSLPNAARLAVLLAFVACGPGEAEVAQTAADPASPAAVIALIYLLHCLLTHLLVPASPAAVIAPSAAARGHRDTYRRAMALLRLCSGDSS